MVLRSHLVGEIGSGDRAKKIIDLALRHKKTSFVGVDKREKVEYGKYLQVKGLKLKPVNVQVKSRLGVTEFYTRTPFISISAKKPRSKPIPLPTAK
jgi:hypothetical protein